MGDGWQREEDRLMEVGWRWLEEAVYREPVRKTMEECWVRQEEEEEAGELMVSSRWWKTR